MTMQSGIKSTIKQRAAELGIDGIGVCDAAPIDEVQAGYEFAVGRGYIPADLAPSARTLTKLATPTQHLRQARSVLSAYEAYYTGEDPACEPGFGTVARYTRANYYEDLRLRLRALAASMEQEFGCKTKVLCCYVTLAEKPLAAKAGIGFYGQHGVIVTPRHGSFVVLGEILTDLDLEPDPRLEAECAGCRKCIEACPTGALRTPYFVDRNLCIQAHCGRRTVVPLPVRDAWQNRFYGCTTCQDACPRNLNLEPVAHKVEHGLVGRSVRLLDVLTLGDCEFNERFKDNQIGMREKNIIRRCALIAAGNSRSDAMMEDLDACAHDPDPMVRQHALWAIWKVKRVAARALLDKALKQEQDPPVAAEIKTLLDGITDLA
ncbi:MAG: tRNA epoxyqueuosine(34) reductase QueG [Candidatus Eisenbacteria bacterium]